MRAHLLTTTAVMALLAAMPAHAQHARCDLAALVPGSGDFNTAGNWNPATVPTGTAFFGFSTITGLTFNSGAANSVGGFLFNNALAGAYSFSLRSLEQPDIYRRGHLQLFWERRANYHFAPRQFGVH